MFWVFEYLINRIAFILLPHFSGSVPAVSILIFVNYQPYCISEDKYGVHFRKKKEKNMK